MYMKRLQSGLTRSAGLWVLVVFFFCLQTMAKANSSFPLIEQALTAYALNDLASVDETLRQVGSEDVFALGMAAFEEGEMPLASIAFLHVLEEQPGNQRARLELARAHYAMHDFDGASHLFNEVLDAHPPEGVRRNIESFLDRIEIEQRRHAWKVQLGGGVFYDDNVNYGPESSLVQVQPFALGSSTIDTLEVQPESRPAEDSGIFTHATLGGVHELGASGAWRGTSGIEYYQSWLSDEDRYNVLYVAGRAGLRYDAPRSRTEIPVKVEQIWLDSDELVRVAGLQPSFAFSQSAQLLHLSELKLQQKDYDTVNSRDAEYYEVRHTFRNFITDQRHQVDLYALGFYEDADAAVFANKGFGVGVASHWRMSGKTVFYAKAGYRGEWYEERERLALEDRKDDRVDLSIGLNKKVTERWAADLGYSHTRNDSSFKVYEYERNLVTLSANCEM